MVSEIGSRAFRVMPAVRDRDSSGVLVALVMTRKISGPIHQLKMSTKRDFRRKVRRPSTVQSWDELGTSPTLSRRWHSPETPGRDESGCQPSHPSARRGGHRGEAETRLKEGGPLAFCLADLRNSKPQ